MFVWRYLEAGATTLAAMLALAATAVGQYDAEDERETHLESARHRVLANYKVWVRALRSTTSHVANLDLVALGMHAHEFGVPHRPARYSPARPGRTDTLYRGTVLRLTELAEILVQRDPAHVDAIENIQGMFKLVTALRRRAANAGTATENGIVVLPFVELMARLLDPRASRLHGLNRDVNRTW